MTIELGLGVVLATFYVSALAMTVLIFRELTPRRQINPPQPDDIDNPPNCQANAPHGFTTKDDVHGGVHGHPL